MSLTLDVKKAFRKSKHNKVLERSPAACTSASTDFKARHILGLDAQYSSHRRKESTSSTSTTKVQSATFSDATTAATSTGPPIECQKIDRFPPDLQRKASNVLLKKQHNGGKADQNLQNKPSGASLRSFYDRHRAPLVVSQQTSDSSSRDFALRRGAPSVLSTSSQEMEHSRQLKFFSKLTRKSNHDKSRLAPNLTHISTNSSQPSLVPSIFETQSDAGLSLASQPSISHISISRGSTRKQGKPLKVTGQSTITIPPVPSATKVVLDPARAKVNVRRPKAGAKNWFDSLDTDSSDDEQVHIGPQFETDLAAQLTTDFEDDKIQPLPPRRSSKKATSADALRNISREQQPSCRKKDRTSYHSQAPARRTINGRARVNAFANADLQTQSILALSSSDDETEAEEPLSATPQELARQEIRASLMNAPWDETSVEVGQARAVSAKDTENFLKQQPHNAPERLTVPRRASSKVLTYLEDGSTETLGRNDTMLTSFPATPAESVSRDSRLRDSVISDQGSFVSTKLMTVTRQEESLIEAMRLKKIAMKRARAVAHRQSTIDILEVESIDERTSQAHNAQQRFASPRSTPRSSHVPLPRVSRQSHRGQDSVTTFQTDTTRETSMRSSIADYMSEGTDDLQLPYSATHGLPLGVSPRYRVHNPRPNRDTFLSEMTVTTTASDTASQSEWSPNGRDSHIVVLDPLDRQLLREEIPSQLFMEHPFVGWEARANMQTAH